jgi:hypothetical protein
MRYVIIRDDDTNALTPVSCLERLYRKFLGCGLPVNLAVIPDVATDATLPDGQPEGFLLGRNSCASRTLPIGSNAELVAYLRSNPGFQVVQHGCQHEYYEFDRLPPEEIPQRLERGTQLLVRAGFARPQAFVAPYDKLSRASLRETSRRFRVLSTGWYEWRRVPPAWWGKYLFKKMRHALHWRVGQTVLLSHPGCLLSCHRNFDTMVEDVTRSINSRRLTVLVTHWWEYFRDGKPDEKFISVLHQTADYLATQPDIKVISFDELVQCRLRLN